MYNKTTYSIRNGEVTLPSKLIKQHYQYDLTYYGVSMILLITVLVYTLIVRIQYSILESQEAHPLIRIKRKNEGVLPNTLTHAPLFKAGKLTSVEHHTCVYVPKNPACQILSTPTKYQNVSAHIPVYDEHMRLTHNTQEAIKKPIMEADIIKRYFRYLFILNHLFVLIPI